VGKYCTRVLRCSQHAALLDLCHTLEIYNSQSAEGLISEDSSIFKYFRKIFRANAAIKYFFPIDVKMQFFIALKSDSIGIFSQNTAFHAAELPPRHAVYSLFLLISESKSSWIS
jgi:hypothetical protein